MTLLTAPETLPFGVALGVLVGLTLIEGLGVMLANSPSAYLDGMVTDALADADGVLDGALAWLHVGKVPLLILLILFLFGFAIAGYGVQLLASSVFRAFLPAWLAVAPALVAGVAIVRSLGGLIGRVIPRQETNATSEADFVGRTGVVVTGVARAGMAAQIRVRDAHGRTHYFMLEPDAQGEELPEGTAVLIVRKAGAMYRGIRDPNAI